MIKFRRKSIKKEKKDIFKWNYISEKLSNEEIIRLKTLYKTYHKLAECHHWQFEKLSRLHTSLHMSSIGLALIGASTGFATLNPIIAGCTISVSAIIQGCLVKSKLAEKVAKCRSAYISYEKILIELKSFLRGLPYDINMIMTDYKRIEDMITDQCPNADSYFKKYDEMYRYE